MSFGGQYIKRTIKPSVKGAGFRLSVFILIASLFSKNSSLYENTTILLHPFCLTFFLPLSVMVLFYKGWTPNALLFTPSLLEVPNQQWPPTRRMLWRRCSAMPLCGSRTWRCGSEGLGLGAWKGIELVGVFQKSCWQLPSKLRLRENSRKPWEKRP